MSRKINSVAVLGGGTMGAGIAGLCAERDCKVLLLDVSLEVAEQALERIVGGRPPALDTPEKAGNITLGTLEDDLEKIADYDWICEAVIEDLATKQALFARIEKVRKVGSVVSSNTSGIPLRDIIEGLPDTLAADIAITHFFNPVKVMRLMELVPSDKTTPDVMEAFSDFCGGTLGKGVVYAKDTVNFIGNRIGCFWMLMGLHRANVALNQGVDMETIDALMSTPVGLPPTGLYGLVDLIGLDVMDFVGKNLALNLPKFDLGEGFTDFPASVQALFDRGQLGRKTGGGFYRVQKLDDGSKKKETFDLKSGDWRPTKSITLKKEHRDLTVLLADDPLGWLAWDLMGETLLYAAGLLPQIADDIGNIDRAMRWGFAWTNGPFQMLDALGPLKVIEKLEAMEGELPKMLKVLQDSGETHFYRNEGAEYLGLDGAYHPVPGE